TKAVTLRIHGQEVHWIEQSPAEPPIAAWIQKFSLLTTRLKTHPGLQVEHSNSDVDPNLRQAWTTQRPVTTLRCLSDERRKWTHACDSTPCSHLAGGAGHPGASFVSRSVRTQDLQGRDALRPQGARSGLERGLHRAQSRLPHLRHAVCHGREVPDPA